MLDQAVPNIFFCRAQAEQYCEPYSLTPAEVNALAKLSIFSAGKLFVGAVLFAVGLGAAHPLNIMGRAIMKNIFAYLFI